MEFISGIVDFEMFRPILERKLQTAERKSNADRPPIDPVLMFKVMFVQRLYGLSDEQAEYQIKDRTSFRDFIAMFYKLGRVDFGSYFENIFHLFRGINASIVTKKR